MIRRPFRLPRRPGLWAPLLLLSTLAACATTSSVPSLPEVKVELARYVESGEYAADVAGVVSRARTYLERRAPRVERPAIVLDIDETSVSNWGYEQSSNFCYRPDSWSVWVAKAEAPPIAPTLELYRSARRLGVAVFFVTGRRESLRADTERNLRAAGYEEWAGLVLKSDDYDQPSVVPYKSGARRQIEADGYSIVVNLGDQASDLAGGFAERGFRLPNPFYLVP